MIQVNVQGGKISSQYRGSAGDFFAGLKDGEYMLFVCKLGDPLPEMEKIIEWFSKLPNDYIDVYGLQNKMNTFASYLFRFASVIGAAALDEAKAETQSAAHYALKKKEYRDRGDSATDAVANAKNDCRELDLQAHMAKAYKDLLDTQMRAAQMVFNAMQMQISLLKKEKDYHEKMGSNVPN
jgi:hypothetical protein